MFLKAAFLFVLIAFSVENYTEPVVCTECTSFLNQKQCTAYQNCFWTSNRSCQIWDSSANTTALSQQSCASQTSTCYGYDGNSTINICAYNSTGKCDILDSSRKCVGYTTQSQCQAIDRCFWSTTQGTCKNHQCEDFQSQFLCSYVVTQAPRTTPCQWVVNQTNGYCTAGYPNNISLYNCEYDNYFQYSYPDYSFLNKYYTYDEINQVCLACVNPVAPTPIIPSFTAANSTPSNNSTNSSIPSIAQLYQIKVILLMTLSVVLSL